MKRVIMLENVDKHEENMWVFNFPVPYTCIDNFLKPKAWYCVALVFLT